MKIGYGQKFSGSSLNPFFLFIALTLGIMSVPATAVIDTNFPQSSQTLICPQVLRFCIFIADSVRNCQVFKPTPSLLPNFLSTSATSNCVHCTNYQAD
jgi:hypothetical protein